MHMYDSKSAKPAGTDAGDFGQVIRMDAETDDGGRHMANIKKRIILIGRTMSGKTTLCQFMEHRDIQYHKTQTIQLFSDAIIDTPGEFLERSNLRGALSVTAVDADVIVLVQPAGDTDTMFPPGYASSFAKPCVGIVTKSDIADGAQIARAKEYLRAAGARRIFVTSSICGTGFEDFMAYLGYEEERQQGAT